MLSITTEKIYQYLFRLRVPASSRGFYQLAYALQLTLEDPERLSAVTKLLYPEIARHYHTTTAAVERNIRRMVGRIWACAPALLIQDAGYPITQRPSSSQAIAILTAALSAHTPVG